MDRIERLVNLVVALLDTERPLTREQLRQRVGGYSGDDSNSRRNFERDKELLRQMGIPVVTVPLDPAAPNGETGYRIPRDLYELPDPGLSEDELTALRLAVSAVYFDGSAEGAATTALWKLAAASARPSDGSSRAGETGGTGPGSSPQAVEASPVAEVTLDERVAVLFAAVAERRPVSFFYSGVERQVDPWRLSYRQGRWYLAGFDHGRLAERLFRVDRVDGEVLWAGSAGAFDRPSHVAAGPPPPWRLGDDDEVEVDLRVDATQAPFVTKLAGVGALVATEADGSALYRLTVTNREAFRSFVLGLLDHAEVLGPADVREDIVSWLRSLAEAGQP
ncbi:MAG: helix-turn-helix transcriptional regulator [Acidimicrobiales bacterium]